MLFRNMQTEKKHIPISSTMHTKSIHIAIKKPVLMNICFYMKLLEFIAAV